MTRHNILPDFILEPIVRNALMEDLGSAGDVTTRAVIPADTRYAARLNARAEGCVSGMQTARMAFALIDPELAIETIIFDGERCIPGDTLMIISGSAVSILAAERVALNLAGRLSGIATLTAEFVARAKDTSTRITCTRKTTPGLRVLEKQAVLHGGGFNHRHNLSDAILIKDNHIVAAGGIRPALEATQAARSHMIRVEIEVDTLAQLEEVLVVGGAEVVLLDNMDIEIMTQAVSMVKGRMLIEASGNMTLERIAEVAATGVDYISSGALTHSVGTVDIALDF